MLPPAEKIARLTAAGRERSAAAAPSATCAETRTNTVFGEGDPDAQIMFIGEGPGENEDYTGRPFVGRAGELLDKMIAAMGLQREQVFIANIVKCRPPDNRVPEPDEVATCTPYLERQIEIVRPRVIVTLGLPAAQYMLQTQAGDGTDARQVARVAGHQVDADVSPGLRVAELHAGDTTRRCGTT